ncbi:MAG TPA: RNA polymerase sigma factor RpoD/SigA [Candidatus Paceibacterota bacterium]|nr:RNA polymerase sigma factor RpoD/SigA [Candidatus Paceibacterota bacterium]
MRQLKITKRITNRDSDSVARYFNEVSKIPLLTDKEEVALANKASKGDEAALDKLVQSNLRFVISVAKQYQNMGLPLQDLINDGNFGLIKAAKKFDNSRGFKFISYAVWWIRQAIMQALAEQSRMIRIPSNQTSSLNKVNKTISKLEQQLEREPTDEEIQESLKEFEKIDLKVKEIRMMGGRTTSLETPVTQDDGALTLLDYIPNTDSVSPDFNLNKDSMASDLEKVLSRLTPRQNSVVCMYFGLFGKQPMTLEEIGENLDLTRERVRQIKDGALRTLKCRGNSSILRQYFDA